VAFENNSNNNLNDSTNDPFDEFEFKPLTDGLGFHRKTESTDQVTIPASMQTSTQIPGQKPVPKTTAMVSTTTSKIDFRGLKLNFESKTKGLSSPLPRTTSPNNNATPAARIQVPTIEDDSISKAQTAVNEILKNLNHKKQQEEASLKNKKKLVWKHSTPSFAAAFLDTMLIMAGFLMMLIAMLTITKSDLISNITHPGEDYSIWVATGLLFATIYFCYMVICRAYLGYTPGEWAFDQRCGTELEQASKSYVPKVMLRTVVVMITGFLPLALISWITRIDLAGMLSGLQVQKQHYV